MVKRLLFSVLVFVTILALANMAEAAFVVTPMEFHLEVAGDGEATGTFYVRNRGDETIALKVYTGDFWIEPSGKELFLEPGKVERSCAKWIEVAPEEMELAPDASQAVRIKMKVPPDAVGSYWAMVFVEQTTKPTIKTAKRGEQQFNILSFQRVGVRVFENTPDAKIGEGIINSVTVKEGSDNNFFEIELKFENKGEVRHWIIPRNI